MLKKLIQTFQPLSLKNAIVAPDQNFGIEIV